jgi:amino acid adenylation domain-containing protein
MAMSPDRRREVSGKQSLSEAKLRLLQERLRGTGPQTAKDGIRPRPQGNVVPLSTEQRRVWLHAQQSDLPIYNEPLTICRHGEFDLATLQVALNEVIRRHEALRTSITPEGEAIIHNSVCVTLPLVDLSELPAAERETMALRIATEDAQKAIPLNSPPLFKAFVVRVKFDEHRLYLTLHHVIFDGVSVARILVPELAAIYASLVSNKPSPLPHPTVQYGDYAIWRERHVESPAVKGHLAYWVDQLSGELPALHLPEDRSRPAIASYRGSMECFKIPTELLVALRLLSRTHGATLYTTLLAAYKVLLFRYSNENDLIVGTVTDGRRRSELEATMGYFLDTFAVRTSPFADLRFTDYLAQTQESVIAGLAAADVPFDRVVQEVKPNREGNQHPIFRVFFSMRPPIPIFSDGWSLSQMDVTVGTSKFDLYLELGEWSDYVEGRFLYSTDIWNASTIKRMVAHWLTLLQSICQNPEGKLGYLPILTQGETVALLGSKGWNNTARAFPQVTLTTLFENQVCRTPHATAAVYGSHRWTYQQLNSRAEKLASSLRSAGINRASIVAVALDRSLDLLAGLVAVLKTGAAYLPLDIQMPHERLALCLNDAQPSAILTQGSLIHLLPESASAIVLVDSDRTNENIVTLSPPAVPAAQTGNHPEDTAYLIYTSGTTGDPKGVEVAHRSLVNLLAAMQTAPGFRPEDVLLAVTPISFDIAALELFLPVISGGTVVIASQEETRDPHLLTQAIIRSGCTVMQATPATWRTLLLSGWPQAGDHSTRHSCRSIRLLCGGETLPGALANRLLAAGGELWNMYGPTETTVWSLIHRVCSETEEEGPVPIGRPIANTRAYILDQRLQPLPVGSRGELFLGGVGLAKGYRGRAQQTAERFTKVDSVCEPRLYRTGDLAVRREDGTIAVLGRNDNQVKIRGHRVELEAVEVAVLRHPHVAAAAARTWPEANGDSRLAVYLVANEPSSAPTLADLRAFLGGSLPDSMIPSEVIVLSSLPLTAHGKLDRTRLPAPVAQKARTPQGARCTRQETRLAGIWGDLLGWEHVGADDNFFDLGGHSLLVAALQQRIAKEFGQQIAVSELFHRPTVRQQAELMQRSAKSMPVLPPGVLALRLTGTRPSIFWMHYLNGQLAKAVGDEYPFLVVSLTADDLAPLGKRPTLQTLAACQVSKILATQPKGPYIIGGQCVGGVLSFEVARQLKAAGEQVALLILLDTPNPSRLQSCDSLGLKLRYLRYLLSRVGQLGVRKSYLYIRELLHNRFADMLRTASATSEMRVAQRVIEAAACAHEPDKYEGKVLLVLASNRPPHLNFLSGWQPVITRDLHVQYVNAHHRDLLDERNVRCIADAIVELSKSDEESSGLSSEKQPAQELQHFAACSSRSIVDA